MWGRAISEREIGGRREWEGASRSSRKFSRINELKYYEINYHPPRSSRGKSLTYIIFRWRKRRKKRSRRALLLPHACNPQTLKRPSTERLVSASAQQIGFRAWHTLGPSDLVIEVRPYIRFFPSFCSIKHVQRQNIISLWNLFILYLGIIPICVLYRGNSASVAVCMEVSPYPYGVERKYYYILYLLSFACVGVFLDIISFSNFRDYSDEIYRNIYKRVGRIL